MSPSTSKPKPPRIGFNRRGVLNPKAPRPCPTCYSPMREQPDKTWLCPRGHHFPRR